jgi:hypothetical protein
VGLAAAVTAATGLAAAGAGTAFSASHPHPHATLSTTQTIKVKMHKHYTVTKPALITTGRVNLVGKAFGKERELDVVRLHKGYTFKHFAKDVLDFGESEGPNGATKSGLKHLRNAIRHITAFGGLDAEKGQTEHETIVLPKAGTYVIYNDTQVPKQPVKLKVTGPAFTGGAGSTDGTIKAKSGERFGGAKTLPHKGTLTYKNVSSGSTSSPHFLDLLQVKKGSTRKEIVKDLQNNDFSFAVPGGGSIGTDVVSPGHAFALSYHMPKGTYAEFCFFPDKHTGIPHALMGMVRVITLK